ncbi:CAMK rad53 protein kinase [Stagonosporopsis vannaccii]|nr:CAMK rad53 protein kinase [Stagonosporopsis vannaccii]
MADEAVAYFEIRLAGCNPFNTHGTIEVCGNEQFTLGRDTMKCRYCWHDDFTISREHLRIHCILYEQDPNSHVAPFVYATDLSANGTYLKKSNTECTGSPGRGISMSKNGSFLLDHGDELQLSETITLIYQSFGTVKQTFLTATQAREKTTLSWRYLITGRLLGEGGYGKVLIGIDQTTQRQLACKMVDLEKLYDRRADLLESTNDAQSSSSQAIKQLPPRIQKCFREFDILKNLSHPNVVHIQKVFWSRSTIYMFQELVTGGDLFSYIEYRHGKISSVESAVIIRQVLKGVQYLHDHDVVHRDLKPDNILMTSLDNGARVVITDFGHARFLPEANVWDDFASHKLQRMFSVVGTAEYAAPEIYRVNGAVPSAWGYSVGVDMWSIGSIAAAVLTGELLFNCRRDGPFDEDAERVIIGLAAECDLQALDDEYHPLWGPIAFAPKDFIKHLLVLDERDRMSATEALNHVWFTHPVMAADFEAQYERSIKHWRPRQKDEQLIEQIPAFNNTAVLRQSCENESFGDTQSHFFPLKQLPARAASADEYHPISNNYGADQFASPAGSTNYDDSHVNSETRSFDHTNDLSQFDKTHDALRDSYSNKRQTDFHNATDDRSVQQTQGCGPANGPATGQLHRVSTKTRSKYFQREIVDLDNLNASIDDPHEITDYGKSNPTQAERSAGQEVSRRGETVLVPTTPPANGGSIDDVELWWHHRYPRTQYHYNTHAEPMMQDEYDVLVQETPPEMFGKFKSPFKAR